MGLTPPQTARNSPPAPDELALCGGELRARRSWWASFGWRRSCTKRAAHRWRRLRFNGPGGFLDARQCPSDDHCHESTAGVALPKLCLAILACGGGLGPNCCKFGFLINSVSSSAMVPRRCAPLGSFTRGLTDRENFDLVAPVICTRVAFPKLSPPNLQLRAASTSNWWGLSSCCMRAPTRRVDLSPQLLLPASQPASQAWKGQRQTSAKTPFTPALAGCLVAWLLVGWPQQTRCPRKARERRADLRGEIHAAEAAAGLKAETSAFCDLGVGRGQRRERCGEWVKTHEVFLFILDLQLEGTSVSRTLC